MTVAPVAHAQPVALPELVDALALRTGAWVVVERFGGVVTHGVGRSECPAAVVAALLAKSARPLREQVRWTTRRAGPGLRGRVGDLEVVAHEIAAGTTAWFVGGAPEPAAVALLRAAAVEEAPVVDAFVQELLHPLGPARSTKAPAALLVVLHADEPPALLARTALAAVAGTAARVHTEVDHVVVALPPEDDPAELTDEVRRRCPDAVAGAAVVADGATDWVAGARLARTAAPVAERLGLALGDSREPRIAAEVVVDGARDAAVALLGPLAGRPLAALTAHDAKGGDLVATLRTWCGKGFDVAVAAEALHVHPNTLRYRLRRAGEVSGLDLDRPQHRLALYLLLAV